MEAIVRAVLRRPAGRLVCYQEMERQMADVERSRRLRRIEERLAELRGYL